MTYRSLLLPCHTKVHCCQLLLFILSPTIQDGDTALERASFIGHHKVVELLLGAGANPDLQDKVRTAQDSGVHVNLSNERWYVLHLVKPGAIVNLPPRLECIVSPYCNMQTLVPMMHRSSACFHLYVMTMVCWYIIWSIWNILTPRHYWHVYVELQACMGQ